MVAAVAVGVPPVRGKEMGKGRGRGLLLHRHIPAGNNRLGYGYLCFHGTLYCLFVAAAAAPEGSAVLVSVAASAAVASASAAVFSLVRKC